MKKNKFINESITLGESIRITSTGLKEHAIWFYLIQLLFIWMGSFTPVMCFIDSFDLVTSFPRILIFSITMTVYFWCIFFLRHYLKFTLPLTILGGIYYIWLNAKTLEQGFYHIENAVIEKINAYINSDLSRYATNYDETKSITAILLMLLYILLFSLSLFMIRGILKEIYMMLSIIFVFSGFLVGNIPNMTSLLSYIIFLFLLFAMSYTPSGKRKWIGKHKENGIFHTLEFKQYIRLKVATYLGIIMTLLVVVICSVFTEGIYQSKVDLKDAKYKIQSSINNFSIEDTINHFKDQWNHASISSFFNQLFGEDNLASGGVDGGNILNTAGIQFNNDTALKLTLPSNAGPFYLKGFAGAEYTGTAWKSLKSSDSKRYDKIVEDYGSETLNGEKLSNEFLQLLISGDLGISNTTLEQVGLSRNHVLEEYNMDVNYVNANKEFLYLPYFYSENKSLQLSYFSDLYAESKKKGADYSVDFYSIPNNMSLFQTLSAIVYLSMDIQANTSVAYKKFTDFELEYRDFVYDVYTEIPKDRRESLRRIDLGIERAESSEATLEVVSEVTDFLASNMSYSLNPGKVPNGEDFIDYFLFESRKGYCVHFASAAVMLLRYYGVPARFVEGYIVTESDIQSGIEGNMSKVVYYDNDGSRGEVYDSSKTVEIHDTNAHAWVEVYIDGIGWLPIEVTGGYYEEGLDNLNSAIQKEVTKIPSPTPLPTNTPKPTITVIPTNQAKNDITTGGKESNTKSKEDKRMKAEQSRRKLEGKSLDLGEVLYRILCIFAFLVVAFYFRYFILKIMKKRKMLKRSRLFGLSCEHRLGKAEKLNHSAIYCYSLIEKMLSIKKYRKKELETYEAFWNRTARRFYDLPTGYTDILYIVMKARYSEELINKDEFLNVRNYYDRLRKNLYTDTEGLYRFWLKYWKVV